jgi:hypothetical protein
MRPPKIVSSSSSGFGSMNIERPITVTIATAGKILGLGATTIWARVGDGTLATVQVGRRRLIVYDSLLRLLTPTCDAVSTTAPRRRGRPRKSITLVAP